MPDLNDSENASHRGWRMGLKYLVKCLNSVTVQWTDRMEKIPGKHCRLTPDLQSYGDILRWNLWMGPHLDIGFADYHQGTELRSHCIMLRLELSDLTGSDHCILQPMGKRKASAPSSPVSPHPTPCQLRAWLCSWVGLRLPRCFVSWLIRCPKKICTGWCWESKYSQNNFDQGWVTHKIVTSLFIFSVIESSKPCKTKLVRSNNVGTRC